MNYKKKENIKLQQYKWNKPDFVKNPYYSNNNWVYNNYKIKTLLEPFKAVRNYRLKAIKNIGRLRKPIKPEEIKDNEMDMQRYLNIYELYNKRKHLCFIWFGKLRRLLKKKKNKKIKLFLWKTLTYINVNDEKEEKNINYQFNNISYNIYNNKKKKSVFYKFFNNRLYSCIIKDRLKLTEEQHNSSILLNIEKNYFLNYWMYLRECISFNCYFHINNYNYNYWLNFYEVIKNNIISRLCDVLRLQNKFIILWPHLFSYKEKKEYNTIWKSGIIDINNILREYKIQNDIFMYRFIRKKKWNKKDMYRWTLKRLKQMVAINIKVQIRFNEYHYVKNHKYEYDNQQNHILDYSKYQMSKKWQLFFNYIKKHVSFNKVMFNRTSINNKYVVKKYYFIVSFIQLYLLRIFNYFKYCYFVNNNSNKLQHFMLKLKLFVFIILLRKFAVVKNKLSIFKKYQQRKLIKNKCNMVRLLFFYMKLWKARQDKSIGWQLKKKNPYIIKEVQLKKENNDKFSRKDSDKKYKQPFFIFKYNPALNPKHTEYVDRQKKKKKGMINYLNRAIKKVAFKQKHVKEIKRKQKIKQLLLSLENDKKIKHRKHGNIVIKNKSRFYQRREKSKKMKSNKNRCD